MAIAIDYDLCRDTSVSLLFSRLGVLQYGRITRAHLLRGLDPGTRDSNGTDPTVPARAVDFVRTKIPVTTPHPTANYSTLLARDYQFASVDAPGMGEVIVAYVFDSPLNPDYTLDTDAWIEQVESWRYKDSGGVYQPFKVDNYISNWRKDTDAPPATPATSPTAYGTAPIFIPRAKLIVTKTVSSATAQTVQNNRRDYLAKINGDVMFTSAEPIGTLLCSRIATATEPWLGRASVTVEFLQREEGWDVYKEYSSPLTGGVPPNVWLAHNSIAANGVATYSPQGTANFATLLSLF